MAFREQLAKRLQKDSDIFYGEDSALKDIWDAIKTRPP